VASVSPLFPFFPHATCIHFRYIRLGGELTFGDSKNIKSYLIGELRARLRCACVYTGLGFYFLLFEHVIRFTALFSTFRDNNAIDILWERYLL